MNKWTKRTAADELPHDVYMQVRYILQGYERMKREKAELLHESPPPANGMPRSGRLGKPAERAAVKLAYLSQRVDAVEQAADAMRQQYRGKMEEDWNVLDAYWSYGYFNYKARRKSPEDLGPCKRTWCYFKNRLSQDIAEALSLY